jgi:hypothetical protein
MELTESQKIVFEQLKKNWALKQSGMGEIADIPARANPIIIGPSGTGKTFTASCFCARYKIPLECMTTGTWLPIGSLSLPHTLNVLAEFVNNHARGLIFIDEINKFQTTHMKYQWSVGVFNELIAVLDADSRLLASNFSPTLIKKLKERFLVVGAGAWQDQWNACKPKVALGFGESETSSYDRGEEYKKLIAASGDILPEELIFRFNEQFLFIFPPSRAELRERIRKIREELKVPELSEGEMERLVLEAEDSGRSMRWLESYVERVIDESGLLKPQIERLGKEITLQEPVGANIKYDQLYNSLYFINKKLVMDCALIARRLSVELEYENPEKNKLISGEICSIARWCEDFTSPLNTSGIRNIYFRNLRNYAKEFHKILNKKTLGALPKETKKLVIELKLKTELFKVESEYLLKVIDEKYELKESGLEDGPDSSREEWYKSH